LLQDDGTSWQHRKKAVANILGLLVGAGTAYKLYTCVNITSAGIFLKCKGLKWGLAKIGEFGIGASYLSAESAFSAKTAATIAAQLTSPPILIGAATGVAVGALVYFVPWNSLFQWLRSVLNGFWSWLVEMFRALSQKVSSWFQKPESRRRRRRRSHASSHHSMRMPACGIWCF
jgi:hypothetical protein